MDSGSCRNDEMGIGMTKNPLCHSERSEESGGGWGLGMVGVSGDVHGRPPGPTRFFVAEPPQNDMWWRDLLRMTYDVGTFSG